MKQNTILVGCDPEVVLIDSDGIPYSSEGLLGGSKEAPRVTEHGCIQEDNVVGEYNIPPAASREEFLGSNRLVLQDLADIIKPLNLSIGFQATARYRDEQLQSIQAITAGCEPDFDAWALDMNPRPNITASNMRSLGGHVHVSFPIVGNAYKARIRQVRVMDLLLGVPSVILDKNLERRQLYGKAGAHRLKYTVNGDPYNGVEYRTLSNFWLATDELILWVYDRTIESVQYAKKIHAAIKESLNGPKIVECINTGNEQLAFELIDEYSLILP